MANLEPERTLWQQRQGPAGTVDPPPIFIRWIHLGSSHIALPDAPVSAPITSWDALTAEESQLCEEAWQKLSPKERSSQNEQEVDKKVEKYVQIDPDAQEWGPEAKPLDDEVRGVPVGRDGLFEIDVKTMRMFPVFWKLNTPPIPVQRATWMYNIHLPVERPLAKDLEDAYLTIKPYLPSFAAELRTSLSLGSEAQQKLRYKLPSGAVVMFQSATMAHIYSAALVRTLPALTSLFSTPPGASIVYRGYDAALRASQSNGRSSSRNRSASIEEQAQKETTGHGIPQAGGEDKEGSHKVTDLILVVHGIGQGLAEQWESFNFVYATNIIRAVARKQALTPSLSSVLRSHRVQFLPVQWRASLKLDEREERNRVEEGLDNAFSVEDITVKGSIPFVRDLTNNVLIDVPYFMSHHRTRMVEAVCMQANRSYRLWCDRHPDFAREGRVHIIAHSLGAALAAHILSDQPTRVGPVPSVEDTPKEQFIFDTGCLFMLGSPLGVFMHVRQSQIIARKGRERTMHSPSDEALDRQGMFGCLAVDSIYNIFNTADPVAYLCNPCVDRKESQTRLPSAIPNITSGIMDGVTSSLSRFKESLPSFPSIKLEGFANPFAAYMSAVSKAADAEEEKPEATPIRPKTTRFLSSIEIAATADAPSPAVSSDRAERRFKALNPHATLDYYLPRQGNVSEYIDMLTAHATYWADPNLSSFILTELSNATNEDLMRTGLGPGRTPGTGQTMEMS